ncbi:extracellular solute-binding protein [Treponema sp.]|uniref:extracellular solute-binding protein n=1 Tax=Treponema sp. TaxID=166 RepID=UPI00388D8963
MKKLLKGIVASALVLAMAAPAFSAKAKTNKDGTVDIEIWYGAAASEAGPIPTEWVGYKIVKDKLKINLKLTALPSSEGDQDTKVNAAAAAKSLPDLCMVSDAVFQKLVDQKLIAPVDKLYAKMPNRTSKLYDKDSRAFTTVKGKSYGLAQPGSIVRNEGVLIRKDWLDKLGLKVPKTTDEFFNVMKAFTEKDPDGNGKNDTYGYGAFLELSATNEGLGRRLDPIFGAFGVAGTWNLASAKTAGLNINKPEYYDAMVYMKKIVDAGVIDPNWMAYKKDDFRAAWKQGRFGIMREQNAAYASQSNYTPFDNNFPDGEWIVIDPPVGPKGKSSCGTYTQAYRTYVVSAKAAKEGKEDKIAELLEWMSSDEGYYLLGWGQEGVNYVFDAKGVPTVNGIPDPSKAYTESTMIPYTQLRNMVYYNGDVELAARYPTWYAKNGKEMSALKALREMQSKAWTACVGQNKMPLPNADLKRFYEQGIVEFMTGKRNLTPADWKAYVAEFNKVGGKEWEDAGVKLAKELRLIK